MLQIFVDNLDLVKTFLEFVIEDIGQKQSKEFEQLTTINLYHRMLEYYLYSKKMNERTLSMRQVELKTFKNKIENFIVKYDNKIDKNYILFLF